MSYVLSVQAYLREIGEGEAKKLGEAPPAPSPETLAGAQSSLERSLQKDAKRTDRIILVAVMALCCLFVFGIVVMVYYRNSPQTLATVFEGGSFGSMLIVVAWLRKLWFDKRTMDLLLALTQSMNPADAARAVTSFYFGALIAKPAAGGRSD
jgi:hypothetical protein